MSKFVRLVAFCLLFGVVLVPVGVAGEITRFAQIPLLKEEPQHVVESQRIFSRFVYSHYDQQINQDAGFSKKIFDRYLNLLDYSRNVLLAGDIEQYASKADTLSENLRTGNLQVFYDLYNLAQQRRFERYQYALKVLERPADFSRDETIDLDRSKVLWPKTSEELDTLWDKKVIYDQVNLRLMDKSEKEIREVLEKRYKTAIRRLGQVSNEDVFTLAMNAFSHSIDPHTNYLSPRSTEQFNTEMSLSLEGIGAVLQAEEDYTQINSLVPGGPAAKSKALNVGDRIVGVGQEGKPVQDVIGWRLDDVVAQIKGPKGSKVKLEILPAGKGAKTHIVTLIRERIRLEDRAAKSEVKQAGTEKVGVITIPGFYIGLTDNVKVQLQKLKKENVQAIIIDLRGDGGGVLSEAVSLSGLFIASGPMVQVRDNNGSVRQDSDTDGIVYYKGPLLVMVDRLSASASEIFAAAMQDYGRALVVGDPTYGKGTVQQYNTLSRIYDQMVHPEWPPLGSVQYTIQKFYRINGGSTQLKGVTPDILMPTAKEEIKVGEKFAENALPWDSISPARYEKVADLLPLLPELSALHQQRISENPEFNYIIEDVERFNANRGKINMVSLNYALREKEDKQDESRNLARANARLKREGKPPVNKLDDLPKDDKKPDPYLDETVHIALDLARMEKNYLMK